MTESNVGTKKPLSITATGMVTGVGLNTASSCAAIRAAIDNFQETRFMDTGGEWVQGCEVPLDNPWRGSRKLAKMLAMALSECAEQAEVDLSSVPIIICLAEKERPGRLKKLGSRVFFETQEELGIRFHNATTLVEHGRVGGLVALKQARTMLYEQGFDKVIVAGVDSLLNAPALLAYEAQDRVLTSKNSNGFIPGEAAAAVLVETPFTSTEPQLLCTGLGFGLEEATIDSEKPLRADGLVDAIRAALNDASIKMETVDFRVVDVSGEQYWFKESSLALLRTLHVPQEEFDVWHPADCFGEVGAAIGPAILCICRTALQKNYANGIRILCHFSNIDEKRGAALFDYSLIKAELS